MIHFDGRGILLDIEGTTSSISFVHDVMFPFVLERLDQFLGENFAREDVVKACDTIALDAGYQTLAQWSRADSGQLDGRSLIRNEVIRLMDSDVKATGLKSLQGLIWESGFRTGQLKAHIYPDVLSAIERWRAFGIDVRIFSSGSIAAQKLFFSHLDIIADHSVKIVANRSGGRSESDRHGDRLHLFSGHYDTTIGSKREPSSYTKIATHWQFSPRDILFISDLSAELDAAAAAGLQVAASIRPGNAPLPDTSVHPQLVSFEEVKVTAS